MDYKRFKARELIRKEYNKELLEKNLFAETWSKFKEKLDAVNKNPEGDIEINENVDMFAKNVEEAFNDMKQPRNTMKDSVIFKQRNKPGICARYFEKVFSYALEFIAAFDMISDIFFLIEIWNGNQLAWFILSIFSIIGPYYICYIPLLRYQRRNMTRNPTKA
jgi:hypothetical protein